MKKFTIILLIAGLLTVAFTGCGDSESIDSGTPAEEEFIWPIVIQPENSGIIFWASGGLEIDVETYCAGDYAYLFQIVDQNTQKPVVNIANGTISVSKTVSANVPEGYYQIRANTPCNWLLRIWGNVSETT